MVEEDKKIIKEKLYNKRDIFIKTHLKEVKIPNEKK